VRIGLLADVHANALGLAAVLAELDLLGTDCVLVAGDLVGYYPYVNEVLDSLRARGCICICGNHDAYLVGALKVPTKRWQAYNLDYADRVILAHNREWLAQQPFERRLEVDGTRILVCHGSPWRLDEYVYPGYEDMSQFGTVEADLIVMGHTHVPLVQREGRVLLVNPGSCGQPRDYNPMASFATYDTDSRVVELRRVAYDTEAVCSRLAAEGFDPALCAILTRTRRQSVR
jgi:putative phosphoesterase